MSVNSWGEGLLVLLQSMSYLYWRDGIQAAGTGCAAFRHYSRWWLAGFAHNIAAVSHHSEDGLRQFLGHTPSGGKKKDNTGTMFNTRCFTSICCQITVGSKSYQGPADLGSVVQSDSISKQIENN